MLESKLYGDASTFAEDVVEGKLGSNKFRYHKLASSTLGIRNGKEHGNHYNGLSRESPLAEEA